MTKLYAEGYEVLRYGQRSWARTGRGEAATNTETSSLSLLSGSRTPFVPPSVYTQYSHDWLRPNLCAGLLATSCTTEQPGTYRLLNKAHRQ